MLIVKMRSIIQSTVGRVFMLGILLAFLLTGLGLSKIFNATKGSINGIATVNGVVLNEGTFRAYKQQEEEQLSFLRQLIQAQAGGQDVNALLRSLGVNPDAAGKALETMIQEELLNQAAETIPVHLSSEYLALKMQDKQFLAQALQSSIPGIVNYDGSINEQVLSKVLNSYDTSSLQAILADQMKRTLVGELVQGAFVLPSWIIKDFYKEHNLSKKFSIGTVSYDAVLKKVKGQAVSEGDLKKFFDEQNEKHKRYYVPAKRSGDQWAFSAQDFGVQVTDEELRDYYDKVKRSRFVDVPLQVQVREIVFNKVKEHGLIELKSMAEKVHADLIGKSEKFADFAKEHSMNETASKGGLVDFFKRGNHDAAYDRAAFVSLKNDGDISEVLEVKNGYVILQRVARKEATFKSFETVKKELVVALVDQKFKTEFVKEAGKVLRKKDETDTALQDFVKDKKGAMTAIPATAKDSSSISSRLFSMQKSGDRVAFIQEGKGIILELKDVLKKVLPPFTMLKSMIESDYYEYLAYKEMQSLVKIEQKAALSSKTLVDTDLMKVSKTDFINPADEAQTKKFTEKGLPPYLLSMDAVGAVVSFVGQKDGYVVKLDALSELKEEAFNAQQEELKKKLYGSYKQMLVRSFIASLRRTATIEINSSFDKVKDLL